MPSTLALPTISDLVRAGSAGLTGEVDRFGDTRSGSLANHIAGPMAICLAREAAFDRDNFRAIYFDDADGDDLTTLIQGRYGIARILDTAGVGTCTLIRPSSGAGAGTIWAGTRIQLSGGSQSTALQVYTVSADTAVPSTALQAVVPIVATTTGTGVAANVTGGIVLLDPLWDATLVPSSLSCADGTAYERADAYRARVRNLLLLQRNGYTRGMLLAAQKAGAVYMLPFNSQYGLALGLFTDADVGGNGISAITTVSGQAKIFTFAPHNLTTGATVYVQTFNAVPPVNGTWTATVTDPSSFTIPVNPSGFSYGGGGTVTAATLTDYGLNAVYVADANFASSPALIAACASALEGARVLGADLWVGGISLSSVTATATVSLIDDPSKFDLVPIQRALSQALLAYFGPSSSGYVYKRAAMAGAMTAAHGAVQTVSFSQPSVDSTLSPNAWPATLSRYTLTPQAINLSFTGPV